MENIFSFFNGNNFRSILCLCLCLLCRLSFAFEFIDIQNLSAGPTKKPPLTDGIFSPGEWAASTKIGNLKPYLDKSTEHYTERTEVYITYDDNAIYFAFRCEQKSKPIRRTRGEKHDLALSTDDSVSVVIKPDPSSWDYYLFCANFSGLKSDERRWDKKWDGKWDFAASCENGYWLAEFMIPWKTIGMQPPDGQKMIGMNVGRNVVRPEGHGWESTMLVWNPTSVLSHNQGRLLLGADVPASHFSNHADRDAIYSNLEISNKSLRTWDLQGNLKIRRKDSRRIVDELTFPLKVDAERTETFIRKIPYLLSGLYEIDLVLETADHQTLLKQNSIVQVGSPPDMELRKYFFHDKIQPIVYLKDKTDLSKARVSFTLRQNKKVLGETTVNVSAPPP